MGIFLKVGQNMLILTSIQKFAQGRNFKSGLGGDHRQNLEKSTGSGKINRYLTLFFDKKFWGKSYGGPLCKFSIFGRLGGGIIPVIPSL